MQKDGSIGLPRRRYLTKRPKAASKHQIKPKNKNKLNNKKQTTPSSLAALFLFVASWSFIVLFEAVVVHVYHNSSACLRRGSDYLAMSVILLKGKIEDKKWDGQWYYAKDKYNTQSFHYEVSRTFYGTFGI